MKENPNAETLSVYLAEYEKLKEEQTHRLTTRDHLIYLTLTAFGAQLAFILGHAGGKPHWEYMLALPIVNIALGWTYLQNDLKISDIGDYVSRQLSPCIRELIDPNATVFGWEAFHRADTWRTERKMFQLLADWLIFVMTGVIGLCIFIMEAEDKSLLQYLTLVADSVFLAGLAWQIWIYSAVAVDGEL